jgi:hypothetical protein
MKLKEAGKINQDFVSNTSSNELAPGGKSISFEGGVCERDFLFCASRGLSCCGSGRF